MPCAMLGRATLTIVVSSTAMKEPTRTTARMRHSRIPGPAAVSFSSVVPTRDSVSAIGRSDCPARMGPNL
jgi:hypothetical protein